MKGDACFAFGVRGLAYQPVASTENPQYGKVTKDTKTETKNRVPSLSLSGLHGTYVL